MTKQQLWSRFSIYGNEKCNQCYCFCDKFLKIIDSNSMGNEKKEIFILCKNCYKKNIDC